MILQNLTAVNFHCVKCIRTKPHSPQFSFRKSVLKSAAKVHTKNYLSICTKHENLKVQLRDPYSWLKWSKCLPIFSWFLILANLTSSLNIMNKKKRKKKNLLGINCFSVASAKHYIPQPYHFSASPEQFRISAVSSEGTCRRGNISSSQNGHIAEVFLLCEPTDSFTANLAGC